MGATDHAPCAHHGPHGAQRIMLQSHRHGHVTRADWNSCRVITDQYPPSSLYRSDERHLRSAARSWQRLANRSYRTPCSWRIALGRGIREASIRQAFLRTNIPLMTHLDYLPYNYVPREWVAIVFIVLFSLSSIVHAVQAIQFRLWLLLPTAVVCGILEIIGWGGRLWSSKNPYLRTPFLMQVSTLIMAPTYLIAANFIILGRITRRLGPQYCRLSPKWFSIFFLTCDTVALTIQAIGGGIASGPQTELGGHIALGGIAIQLVVLILYTALAAEFVIRFTLDRPMRRIRENGTLPPRGTLDEPLIRMLIGMSIMATLLLVRSIYRMVELSGGWRGKVISIQWLFDVFDGATVFLAIFTLNVFHPGVLLRGQDKLEPDILTVSSQEPESETLLMTPKKA